MAVVIIKVELEAVEEEVLMGLLDRWCEGTTGLEEIPELPGICLSKVLGFCYGDEKLPLKGLQDKVTMVNGGNIPSRVLLVIKD